MHTTCTIKKVYRRNMNLGGQRRGEQAKVALSLQETNKKQPAVQAYFG